MPEIETPTPAAVAADERNVVDETEAGETTAPVTYAIGSFGSDPEVEVLVKRLEAEEILIPPFQRNYIWTLKEASRFIESLLLGLPVPGIFMARERQTNKMLVIDGQQRLKSLQFFYGGYFNPKPEARNRRVFKLQFVQSRFENRTYKELDENDRRLLDSSVIHATIIKQEEPKNDDTSIYHVFERLNSGGRKLAAQEIRTAVCHGALMGLLSDLNVVASWREIYGKESPRLKDRELILRFLALNFEKSKYERPMSEFLTKFANRHKDAPAEELTRFTKAFVDTIDLLCKEIGSKVFRIERALNAAVFDAVMVGLAHRLSKGTLQDVAALRKSYKQLTGDRTFNVLVASSTAGETNIRDRIKMATDAFAGLK
ncbi:MAG TPA: DUF262 domain-containing protein [Chthoniobacteraceae bacterium]|jgi:hypothetical protein|nr:DUF262 domain-containing protein [Chthoniobacteraceae bacterium]